MNGDTQVSIPVNAQSSIPVSERRCLAQTVEELTAQVTYGLARGCAVAYDSAYRYFPVTWLRHDRFAEELATLGVRVAHALEIENGAGATSHGRAPAPSQAIPSTRQEMTAHARAASDMH